MQLIDATRGTSCCARTWARRTASWRTRTSTGSTTFLAFEETEQSKIFPTPRGYRRRRRAAVASDRSPHGPQPGRFRATCAAADEEPLAHLVDRLAASLGPGPHTDYNTFLAQVEADAERHGVKLTAKRLKLLQTGLAQRDERLCRSSRRSTEPGKFGPPVPGRYAGPKKIVEYEPDPELRDTKQIPLLEPGGIEAFLRREVLPHVPDAWYDPDSVKIGYEISFTRYFYKPQPLRSLAEIRADILAVEQETEGLLDAIYRLSGQDYEPCFGPS